MQRNASFGRALWCTGFTLLELLVTLAVVAITLTFGLPAYNKLTASGQQSAEINQFVTHLQLARSQAVKTGRNHVLCPSSDQLSCLDSASWEQGYILFEDLDGDGLRGPKESLLRTTKPLSSIAIGMASSAGRTRVIYRPNGASGGSNLTLVFCDPLNHISPKAVIVSNTGRPRVASTRWDGSPLQCSR